MCERFWTLPNGDDGRWRWGGVIARPLGARDGPDARAVAIPAGPQVARLLRHSNGGSCSAWGSGLRQIVDGGFHPQARRKACFYS